MLHENLYARENSNKVCFMTKTISNDAMQKKGTSQMGKELLIYVVRWVKGFQFSNSAEELFGSFATPRNEANKT